MVARLGQVKRRRGLVLGGCSVDLSGALDALRIEALAAFSRPAELARAILSAVER